MKHVKTTWIVAAAGTLLCTGLAAQAQDTLDKGKPIPPATMREEGVTLNFDKDAIGKLPMGWKAAVPGKTAVDGDTSKPKDAKAAWVVIADPTAPSAPNVMEVTGSTQGVNGYNICIQERHAHKDVDVSAKLRGNTGTLEQGGGVAWRVKDAENFYACAFNPSDGRFRVFKVVGGQSQELGSANFPGSGPGASTWYTLSARMIGDTITCSINGQELLHATDTTFKDRGHIALWTKADAASSFDDVVIKSMGDMKKESKESKGTTSD